MLIDRVTHQKSGKPERTETRQGETLQGIGRDEAGLAQHEPEGLGRTDWTCNKKMDTSRSHNYWLLIIT